MADAEAIWTAKTEDELLEAAQELSEYKEEGERIIRRIQLPNRSGRVRFRRNDRSLATGEARLFRHLHNSETCGTN